MATTIDRDTQEATTTAATTILVGTVLTSTPPRGQILNMNRKKPAAAAAAPVQAASQRNSDYSSLVREANSFNSRLVADRTRRLPFIDNQTGVAQRNCRLWRSERERFRCQAADESSAIKGSLLYSYPSQHRLRRHQQGWLAMDQIERQLAEAGIEQARGHPSDKLICSSSASLSSASSSSGPTVMLSELAGENSKRLVAFVAIKRHPQQSAPSRADSTGSHSFADSDSRDHSSGASQSIGSPRSQLLDDDQHQQLDLSSQRLDNDNDETTHEEMDERERQLYAKDVAGSGAECFIGRTDRAIERRKRNGKRTGKKNSFRRGETSLLASADDNKNHDEDDDDDSIENNGRTTTQDNNQDKQIKKTTNQQRAAARTRPAASQATKRTPEERSSPEGTPSPRHLRPYVCPICDQSYKTRPGLSYHFIHAHGTVLPRSLPVKNNGEQHNQDEPDRSNATGDIQTARKKRKHIESPRASKESTRVLRHYRRAVADERVGIVSNEVEAPGNSGRENCTVIEEDDGNEQQADHEDELNQDTGEELVAGAAESETNALDLPEEPQEKTKPANENEDHHENQVGTSDNPNQVSSQPPESAEVKVDQNDSGVDRPAENGVLNNIGEGSIGHQVESSNSEAVIKPGGKQNLFCDFCLGTADKNRRTRLPEELISCSSCGSSGHPSCLRFSENIRRSVQRYDWQCIECKTCSTCNQADHEDQLLFCDDCDRSYHTYCLSPRLDHPPEGNWTCKPCLNEYYTSV